MGYDRAEVSEVQTVNVLPKQEKTKDWDSGPDPQRAMGRMLYEKGMSYLPDGFQRKSQEQ